MIEVKTTTKNNYKLGKSTINQRIGEDFEPDKPIIANNNFKGGSGNADKMNSPDIMSTRRKSFQANQAAGGQPGNTSEERVYQRKLKASEGNAG